LNGVKAPVALRGVLLHWLSSANFLIVDFCRLIENEDTD